ncbi:MAG: hypothetical protein HUU60_09595 [Armatimonadetes bacterium]|nr:hypothetical protein [Armatimonadota bacterium]
MRRHVFVLWFALLGLSAGAQTPTVESIMDKYIEASGGREAMQAVKSMRLSGKLTIKNQGITGAMEISFKAPNKVFVKQDITGIGSVQQGFDGKTGWAQDPFSGLRDLEGAELEALKREASLESALNWKQHFKKWEYLGEESVKDKKAHKVSFEPKVGKPVVKFFDVESGQLIRQDGWSESPMGEVPVSTYLSDYRKEGNITMPFKMTASMAQVEIEIQFSKLETNIGIEDKIFVRPGGAPKDTEDKPLSLK